MVLSLDLSDLKLKARGQVRAERAEREIINRAESKIAEFGHLTSFFLWNHSLRSGNNPLGAHKGLLNLFCILIAGRNLSFVPYTEKINPKAV